MGENVNVENSGTGLNLYQQTVDLIGPVPPQYECIYFVGMFAILFGMISVILAPIILFRRR